MSDSGKPRAKVRRAIAIAVCFMVCIGSGIAIARMTADRPRTTGVWEDNIAYFGGGRTGNQSAPSGSPSSAHSDPSKIEPPSCVSGAANENTIKVICRGVDGKPVSGVRVSGRIQGPRIKDPANYDEKLIFVSGDDGSFEACSRDENRVDFRAVSEGKYSKKVSTDFSRPLELELVIFHAATIKFRAQYDDGLPVTYMAKFRNKERGLSWDFALRDDDGTAEVPKVATDEDLHCLVFAQRRPGYGTHEVKFSKEELQSGRELLVVVPKSDRKEGGLRVEFLNAAATRETQLLLEWSPAPVCSRYQLSAGQTTWEEPHLNPARKYRVTILGEYAWRSEWINIIAGETKTVQATLARGATVQAKLVDTRAQPIKDGVLRLSDGTYLGYSSGSPPRPSQGRFNITDDKGFVTLKGLPPGKFTVEAESWGKEPVQREIEVSQGSAFDIGDVVLEDARGIVEIDLVGCAKGEKYAIVIAQFGGQLISPFFPIDGTKHKLVGLPLRKYTVGVTFLKGGTIVSTEVDLSVVQTTRAITLDAGQVKP